MERIDLLNLLDQKFKTFRIVALFGPRQCGKTTLAKAYIAKIPDFVRRNYFDLENPNDYLRLSEPYQNLKDLTGLIVIDEVQRSPELFPVLRVLHDEFPDKRFLILGSASKHLLQQSSESLTGRICYEEITPFSSFETGEWKKLWFRGGFPRSYLAASDEESFEWLDNYVRTLLEQDIPNLGFRIPATHLRRFWAVLSHTHGQIFNGHSIGRSLDLSAQSMRRYLDLLTDMLTVRQLAPFYANISKRQVKMPKIYIRDSGVLHLLTHVISQDAFVTSANRGASFEGFVIEEVLRVMKVKPEDCFYWRTHAGAEIDLLILRGSKKIGFEIKLTDRPSITKSMHIARQDLCLSHTYLVHPGDITWKLDEDTTALSISDITTLRAE